MRDTVIARLVRAGVSSYLATKKKEEEEIGKWVG